MEWGKPDQESMASLASYRASGSVTRVEVDGDPDRCSYCRDGFDGIHDINSNLMMPPPQCDHEFGFCIAAFLPIIDDFGEDDGTPMIRPGESREYEAGDLIMVVQNIGSGTEIKFKYSFKLRDN